MQNVIVRPHEIEMVTPCSIHISFACFLLSPTLSRTPCASFPRSSFSKNSKKARMWLDSASTGSHESCITLRPEPGAIEKKSFRLLAHLKESVSFSKCVGFIYTLIFYLSYCNHVLLRIWPFYRCKFFLQIRRLEDVAQSQIICKYNKLYNWPSSCLCKGEGGEDVGFTPAPRGHLLVCLAWVRV